MLSNLPGIIQIIETAKILLVKLKFLLHDNVSNILEPFSSEHTLTYPQTLIYIPCFKLAQLRFNIATTEVMYDN